jgi:hypothetical protein
MKMLFRTTCRLFHGKYQYKVVLICPGARNFKNSTTTQLREFIKYTQESLDNKGKFTSSRYNKIKTQDDLDYAIKLHNLIKTLKDFSTRVEDPWLSFYTNNLADINQLINLDKSRVKCVYQPDTNVTLVAGSIVMPRTDYEYRVTVRRSNQNNSAFVKWAENNKKVKLTKGCALSLSKDRSFGGNHFYISGDNNLLIARMHLGGCIQKIERIIKA